MSYYVNYEGGKINFDIPAGWKVISNEETASAPVVDDIEKEVKRALDNPIGSGKIEELAKPGMDAVILFDDTQRPTPTHEAMPEIMNRLNLAGIPDGRIRAVCAVGTHRSLSINELEKKTGKEAAGRLKGRLVCHDPHSGENVVIGRTHRGTLVEVNKLVAFSDLIIGIGECMPHPSSGFGGGCKIVMPGVSSFRAVADHHFHWMRNRDARINLLDGNPFYEEIVDAGRLSRLAFKLDFIINEKKQVIRAFAGDPVTEHREASKYAASLYFVSLPKRPDIIIAAAAPLEIGVQPTKALLMAGITARTGGTIIWIASQKQAGPVFPLIKEIASSENANEFHRRLLTGDIPEELKPLGISFIMQVVYIKELSEKFRVIHVTEGLTREHVQMMKFEYAASVKEAIGMASADMPKADVAIFPSGGSVIPGIK